MIIVHSVYLGSLNSELRKTSQLDISSWNRKNDASPVVAITVCQYQQTVRWDFCESNVTTCTAEH